MCGTQIEQTVNCEGASEKVAGDDDCPCRACRPFRICIKALRQVGMAKPQYIPRIIARFRSADLSEYKGSMRPLIGRDMAETERALTQCFGFPEVFK